MITQTQALTEDDLVRILTEPRMSKVVVTAAAARGEEQPRREYAIDPVDLD